MPRPAPKAGLRHGSRKRAPLLIALATAVAATGTPAWSQSLGETVDTSATPPAGATADSALDAVPGGAVVGPAELPDRQGGFFGFPYDGGSITPPGSTEPSRAVTVAPSVAVQVMGTDNVTPGTGNARADIVSTVTPELRVSADTVRLQGVVRYAPSLRLYAFGSDDTRVDHRFSGSALTTLIPGSLFLDTRGSAAVVPVSGGVADAEGQSISRRDSSQTANASITPYHLYRFGSIATSLVGYTYQYGRQGGQSRSLVPGGPAFTSPQDFSSHTGFVAVRTGDDFGPVAVEARATGTSYDGTGVLDGASRALGIVEGRYAFSRSVIAIGEIGYEKQEYGGVPPILIEGVIGAVGVKLSPSPNSTLTARFQHRDGVNSPSLDARIGLGVSTVLFARYSDQLATSVQQNADLLATTVVDEFGNPVDSRSGEPSRNFAGNSLMTQQSGLFRNRRLTATVVQSLGLDTVSFNVARDERIPVAVAAGETAFRQESTSGGVTWTHPITEATTFVTSFRYGWLDSTLPAGVGTQKSTNYTARATLAHRFSPTLTGSAQYLLSNRSTDFATSSPGINDGDNLQNAVILTLRKTF